ncbi:MAG: hypothetical protein WA398_06750, partial [Nitrososphaeraceae archaeon]
SIIPLTLSSNRTFSSALDVIESISETIDSPVIRLPPLCYVDSNFEFIFGSMTLKYKKQKPAVHYITVNFYK